MRNIARIFSWETESEEYWQKKLLLLTDPTPYYKKDLWDQLSSEYYKRQILQQ